MNSNVFTHKGILISRKLGDIHGHSVGPERTSFAFLFPRKLLEQTKRETDAHAGR